MMSSRKVSEGANLMLISFHEETVSIHPDATFYGA
jgi:hypothetical protein